MSKSYTGTSEISLWTLNNSGWRIFVLLDKQTKVLVPVLQPENAESQDIELSDVIAVGLKKES